jgi:molecular chaperone DnaJ
MQDLELDLEQICQGGKTEVGIEIQRECEACAGAGYQESAFSQPCATCHGSGRIRRKHGLANCPDCDGRGYTHRVRCPACDGKGRILSRRAFTVTLQPGMLPGDELRLEGKGYPADSPDGQPGDLRMRIVLRPHPLFSVEGSDIAIDRPVSAFILLTGGAVAVPTPTGPRGLHLDIPPGPAAPREITIPDGGIPARGKRAAGTLKVRLLPCLPSISSPALVKLYHALQKEIDRTRPQCCPELDAWEKRWLSPR